MPNLRAYLGDGLYADWDGSQIVLTAENGIAATDTVYLNPRIFANLQSWYAGRIAPTLTN